MNRSRKRALPAGSFSPFASVIGPARRAHDGHKSKRLSFVPMRATRARRRGNAMGSGRLIAAVAASLLLASGAPSRALDFPTGVVRIIVPYLPGGSAEAQAR